MTRAQLYEKFVEYQRLRDLEYPGSLDWWKYQRHVVRYFKKIYGKEMANGG